MENIDTHICSLIADSLTYKDVVSLAMVSNAVTPAYLSKRRKMAYKESLDIISSIFIIRRDYGKKICERARYVFDRRLAYIIEYTNSNHIIISDWEGRGGYGYYKLPNMLKSEMDRGVIYVHSIINHEYLHQTLTARRDNGLEMEFMTPRNYYKSNASGSTTSAA